MGLFDFLSKQPKRFVSQNNFERNLDTQMSLTPQTLQQLRQYDVTPEKELKLEFFFYTDTAQKAVALVEHLQNKGYDVKYDLSASNKKVLIITGWTTKIPMSDNIVLQWTKEMCDTGFSQDCDFDGWGTNPEQ
jgi:hypothetical protein